MSKQLRLEVVTPQRILVEVDVDSVTLPGSEGELGILPEHIPLLTTLNTGLMTYRIGGKVHAVAVHWGYAQVEGNQVVVLAELAETAAEIDTTRAQSAQKKAEDMLKQLYSPAGDKSDAARFIKYENKLKRAIVRLHASNYR
ncbi:F0F1 ATP synthase subunit epsilon [Deltaproteobacteria bacterium TL4]